MSGGKWAVSRGFVGTGANIDIRSLPGRPLSVKIVNRTGLVTAEWNESMPDGSMCKRVTAGTMTFPTTLGITPLSDGFRIGADTDVNVAGEVGYWEAIGPSSTPNA